MTHGKANNHTHRSPQQFGALILQPPPVEGSAYDNFVAAGKMIQPRGAKPQPLVNLQKTRSASPIDVRQPKREYTSLHSASSLQARSTVLRGGVASCPNRARYRHCGLGERSEQLFAESSSEKIFPSLGAFALNSGRTRRPTSSWRSTSAARSARRNFTSAATASLPMKRSWSCSTSYGPGSGLSLRSGLVPGMETGLRGCRRKASATMGIASAPCTGNAARPVSVEFAVARSDRRAA